MVNDWLNYIQNYFFGQKCQLCLATAAPLAICPDCQQQLPHNNSSCRICSLPLETDIDVICGQCQKQKPYFDTSLIPFLYETPVKQLITRLKFHHDLVAIRSLSQLFNQYFSHLTTEAQCIIPVPLHPKRLAERGYNQALELARPVAKALSLKIDYSICKRPVQTEIQSGLSATKRKQNIKNAFNITAHSYTHVIIFDDVVTTGATVNELSKALKQSGVKTVEVWAIARAYKKY